MKANSTQSGLSGEQSGAGIKQKDFPDYCIPRTERIQRNPRWTDVGPHDDKLGLALDRIFNLRADGLTIEMVGADFLWRRIAPLQQRGRRAWEYKNAADTMRLYPGLPNNLTVLEHNWLICRLFNKGCNHTLPEMVIPLCNNTARDSILAMMPACNAQGLEATWQQPEDAIVEEWFNNLVETPRRMEDDLIHPTKENELEFIAERAEAVRGVGGSRTTGGDTEEEEEEDEEDNAGERGGEKPPAPPALKRAAAAPSTSKRPVQKKPASSGPARSDPAGTEVGAKVPRQQAFRQQPSGSKLLGGQLPGSKLRRPRRGQGFLSPKFLRQQSAPDRLLLRHVPLALKAKQSGISPFSTRRKKKKSKPLALFFSLFLFDHHHH